MTPSTALFCLALAIIAGGLAWESIDAATIGERVLARRACACLTLALGGYMLAVIS